MTVTDSSGSTATFTCGLSVFTGIAVNQVGDIPGGVDNRLCFDSVRNVEANSLPNADGPGVTALSGSTNDLIDWYMVVEDEEAELVDNDSGSMGTLTAFPQGNTSWGPNILYVSIDGSDVTGQEGELNLTGTSSFIGNSVDVFVFYDLHGTQCPSGAANPVWAGKAQNWFYYYSQTSANYGSMLYGGYNVSLKGECDFGDFSHSYPCYLYNGSADVTSVDNAGANFGETFRYIDSFAFMCRHEWQHHLDMVGWWSADAYVSVRKNDDTDNDFIPDAVEMNTNFTAIQGGPFVYPNQKTDGVDLDGERHCRFAQAPWTQYNAQAEDWAHPGIG